MTDQQNEGNRQASRLAQALADCEASLRRARRLIDQQAEQIKTIQTERERRVTENDSEFLMRTLTSQQWKVIGRKVQAEIQLAEAERDAARAARDAAWRIAADWRTAGESE